MEMAPSPLSGMNHLHSTGDKPVIEPKIETQNARDAREGVVDLFSEQKDAPPVKSTDHDFDRFWAVYPKKAGKPAAKKAFVKAVKVAPTDRIIEGAERYAAWLKSGGPDDFRPQAKHPQGWLNDQRWDDPELWEDHASRPQSGKMSYAQQVKRQYGKS